MISFPFEIAFEPSYCNFEKSYSIKVDGVESSPFWLSLNTASDPVLVEIYTTNMADAGIYSINIASKLNTNPAIVSSDSYDFVVIIQGNTCSQVVFDS